MSQPSLNIDQDTQINEQEFCIYLGEIYKSEKTKLEKLPVIFETEQQRRAIKNGLFVIAVGLLACGRLDVVDEILIHVSSLSNEAKFRRLAMSIKTLLPLPEHLDPIENPEETRNWIWNNIPKLEWNASEEKYIFRHTSMI